MGLKLEEELESGRQNSKFNHMNLMLVCLQGQDEHGLYGKIVSRYLDEAVSFHGTGELVICLDRICDWIGAPQRAAELRFLNNQHHQEYQQVSCEHPSVTEESRVGGMDPDTYVETLRASEVVTVNMEYRQNASIQGTVCGKLTDEKRVAFRSALELMHMFSMITLHQ